MNTRSPISSRVGLSWLLVVLLGAPAYVGCKCGSGDGGSGGAGTGGNGTGGAGTGGAGSGGAGSGGGGSSGAGNGDGSGGGPVVTSGYDCTAPSGEVPELEATPVVTDGLDEPIYLTHEPNGDASRLFVLERGGLVRIIEDGVLLEPPFLDFSSKVGGGGEQGALGLAFHPDYAQNGLFYLHYNDGEDGTHGDSLFEEYRVTSDANVADPDSARLVLRVPQPDMENHKGGSITFGADGLLYIGLGDGGGGGDPSGNGQNVQTLLGKLLRIDPRASGGAPYSSPPGNLRDSMPSAAPEIWDYGLRNPFRFTFDACTGDLYIGDVGQNALEELDIEKAGDGHRNYGWNQTEGNACFEPATDCDWTGITRPILDYDRDAGKSITGGAVYRGASIPSLRGTYFYADYQDNHVWSVVYDRAAGVASAPVSHTQELNNVTRIVSITNGADGELYFVSLDGGVYKLEAAE